MVAYLGALEAFKDLLSLGSLFSLGALLPFMGVAVHGGFVVQGAFVVLGGFVSLYGLRCLWVFVVLGGFGGLLSWGPGCPGVHRALMAMEEALMSIVTFVIIDAAWWP
jgi:hypothetical protein